ncbi:efflux transporter periplasmic adaptor subunit [Pollutimonas nitritireducens]|uniref:Efflux transporter periplasmic adaptor subunit n=1 Tax=Pollutimonas nitritireducens TaxID=2045209 RepID=A0A2N4UD89_9BURK|nr:efflux RND transporter periplasmic adaptor subunit [Pollutimonas nitritireducens]PLC52967.1 efflux transporter periplasmic adaptor subunit [Pollutimonas nitritireducens]
MNNFKHQLTVCSLRLALGLALVATSPFLAVTAYAAEENHESHSEAETSNEDSHEQGPNGGEVTQTNGFALELLLAEEGGEPRLRIWSASSGAGIPIDSVTARGQLTRPNGTVQSITFSRSKGYLQSEQIIEEPHFFSLNVEVSVGAGAEKKTAVALLQRQEGKIALSDEQIAANSLVIETAGPATLQQTLLFPGEIKFNEDRTAHVVPRLSGIVESVSAVLGEQVKTGQVLATISSAALADMRSELLASQKRYALASTVYKRERKLWQEKVSAEQDYLQARATLSESEIALQNIKQKLTTVGASPSSPQLSRLELRAPFDGVIIEKHISLGESVREDVNVFTLSDLRTVWVEFQIAAKDLESVQIGKKAEVSSTALSSKVRGTVSYVGALIGQQTRTATARITLDNPNMAWRPGLFVTVSVAVSENDSGVTVAADAIQTIEGQPVVFIVVPGGFLAQPVKLGTVNNNRAEIAEGLSPGIKYVAVNSFILKSELGKASAEHAH